MPGGKAATGIAQRSSIPLAARFNRQLVLWSQLDLSSGDALLPTAIDVQKNRTVIDRGGPLLQAEHAKAVCNPQEKIKDHHLSFFAIFLSFLHFFFLLVIGELYQK